jgi:ferredoxin-NADP reductase
MWRQATLTGARKETGSARTLQFRVDEWPGHLAGQHVDVRLTAADGYTAQRSYSLSAPAAGEAVEITVQRVPDGEVSPYLVDDIEPGDTVEVLGPLGGWFVWRPAQTEPTLLLGGGSGIAPLMAMLRAARAAGASSAFRVLYSVRAPQDVYFADELLDATRSGAVRVIYTRSAPASEPRPPGRVTASDLAAIGWPAEARPTCYVCGPTPFVEAVANVLVSAGHDPDRIRTERFGATGG